MSVEIEKKKRKAPAKKAGAEGEAKPKAVRAASAKVKVGKDAAAVAAVESVVESIKVRQWPSHEEIAVLAHRYYEQRGGQAAGLWYDGYDSIAYDCMDAADARACLAL